MGPDMTVIGYARVSTDGQSLEAQHAALTQAAAERVFAEKISGAVTDRKQLAKAIAPLSAGDVLLVTRETLRALTTRAREGHGGSIAAETLESIGRQRRSVSFSNVL
jgi:DNA invertase Pin-like site-specific DNA recombinase